MLVNACQNRIYLKVFYSKEEGCRGMIYGIGCILLRLACQPASSRAASWMWCSMAEIRMSTPCQP